MDGEAISRILNAIGPVVKCVLIRPICAKLDEICNSVETGDKNKKVTSETTSIEGVGDANKIPELSNKESDVRDSDTNSSISSEKVNLSQLSSPLDSVFQTDRISEITVDMTPQKRQVESILGGPFTFLGQYDKESVVAVVRKESEIINDIKLPRPLDKAEIKGAVLLMKVADDDDFFGNFRKEDFLALAKKKLEESSDEEEDDDIESIEDGVEEADVDDGMENDVRDGGGTEEDHEEDEDSLNDEDEEGDGDYLGEDMEEIDEEEEKVGMMNMLMGQILRTFNKNNGRGPDTQELLEMRQLIASRLGVDVPEIDEDENSGKKRENVEEDHEVDGPRKKKIRFSNSHETKEFYVEEPYDDGNSETEKDNETGNEELSNEKGSDEKVTDEKVADEKVADEKIADEKISDAKESDCKVTDAKVDLYCNDSEIQHLEKERITS